MQLNSKLFSQKILTLAFVVISGISFTPSYASNCKWFNDQSGSYCVIAKNEGKQKVIEVILRSNREGTKVMTYRGKSFSLGSAFVDDEYNGVHILKYFGSDKIVLQDKNGNPPNVYLR